MNRKEMPAPFEIAKTYVSKHGSGRTCETPQGWEVSCPGVFMWGRTRAGHEWYSSKREAIGTMWKRYDQAHTGNPKELANLRVDYIAWLLKVWPDAPAALKAKAEFAAKCAAEQAALKVAVRRNEDMMVAAQDLKTDAAFVGVVGALRSKGFNPGEIYVVIGGALEVK
jgi:hypothetical protein